MTNDDEVVRLLTSIDRRLALLTATLQRDLRAALENEVLRIPARMIMFNGIDGKRTGAELAKLANQSERAGQQFVTDMLALGLVRRVAGATGRAVIVERDDDAILEWYLRRDKAGS